MVEEITTHVLHNHGPTDDASALPDDLSGGAGCAARPGACTARPIDSPTSRLHRRGRRIPPGTYEARSRPRSSPRPGWTGTDFAEDVTFTYVLRPDGTFRETQDPDFPDQGPSDGRYDVDGYQVTFTTCTTTSVAT